MADSKINIISLFSGAAGFDLGVSIALPRSRVVAFVEWEAYAASILLARMEDKTLDQAPVWCGDIKRFNGREFNGHIDMVVGGFPCTDLSVAGKQAGINGSASGLWWEFARIICEVQPRWVFIENVPPVLSAEPARAVLGELSRLGFNAEWTTLRASEVGASHQRKRVFILAYRQGERWRKRWLPSKRSEERACGACSALADSSSIRFSQHGADSRTDSGNPWRLRESQGASCSLANTTSTKPTTLRFGNEQKQPMLRESDCDGMADTSKPGREITERTELPGSLGLDEGRAATELRGTPFPPGPGDTEAWQRIFETNPEFAPALEPGVRGMADELASPLHERRHRLRATGNGVVAIQAAVAFTLLMRRIMK